MTLAPYPKYRPSGIEWLGDVPEHWEVMKLKHLLRRVIPGGTPDVANDDYWTSEGDTGHAWVAIADLYEGVHVRTTRRRVTEAGRASKRLLIASRGTLLYSMYATLGRVGVLEIHAAFNQAILGIDPDPVLTSNRFLFYWLDSSRRYIEVLASTNTQDNLSAGKVRNMVVVVPSISEQQAISAFLDGETAKLDAIVRKQQTLIERLREKRSALITETVTRGLPPDAARAAGLDPNPPRRPSGVEWLGDLPAHWALRRSDAVLARVRRQIDRKDFRDQEVMHYSIPSVQETGTGAVEPGESIESGKQVVAGPVVLVSRLNPRKATVCCAEPHPTLLTIASVEFVALRPTSTVLRFLFYLQQTEFVRQRLHAGVRSVTRSHQRVEADSVYRFWHAWPPTEEQQAIADYLDRETAKLDALVAKIETAIERLREYRSALITAAVTGKVDVRSTRQPAPAKEGSKREALRP